MEFHFLPVKGKKPLKGHSIYNATSDQAQIDIWKKDPECSLGIVCGEKSGITVIDIDIKKGVNGLKEFNDLCNDIGIDLQTLMASTLTVQTLSGGYHLYFKYCVDFSTSSTGIIDGVDIRNNNTYVVFPSKCNQYSFISGYAKTPFGENYTIKEMPPGLATALLNAKAKSKSTPKGVNPFNNAEKCALPIIVKMLVQQAVEEAYVGIRRKMAFRLLSQAVGQGYGQLLSQVADTYADELEKAGKNPDGEDLAAEYKPIAHELGGKDKLEGFAVDNSTLAYYVKAYIDGKVIIDEATNKYYALEKNNLVFTKVVNLPPIIDDIQRALKKDIEYYLNYAQNMPDNKHFRQEALKLKGNLFKNNTNALISTALAVATRDKVVELDAHEVEADYHVCKNVILDLRPIATTGKPAVIAANDGKLPLTRRSNFAYDPKADCPIFKNALAEILPDPLVQKAIQRYIGYSLTNNTRQAVSLWCVGTGSNGKSLLASIFLKLFVLKTGYAGEAKIRNFLTNNSAVHTSNLQGIFGSRLCVINESPQAGQIDLEEFKRYVDGGNSLRRDAGAADQRNVANTAKLLFTVNNVPAFKTQQPSAWRRMWFIKFEQTFCDYPNSALGERKIDYTLEDRILKSATECSGILNWALEGLAEVVQNAAAGVGIFSDIATKGTQLDLWKREIRRHDDVLADFFDDAVEITDNPNDVICDCYTKIKSHWVNYENQRDENFKAPTGKAFSDMLNERIAVIVRDCGYGNVQLIPDRNSRHKRKLVGVKLKSPNQSNSTAVTPSPENNPLFI